MEYLLEVSYDVLQEIYELEPPIDYSVDDDYDEDSDEIIIYFTSEEARDEMIKFIYDNIDDTL